MLAAVQQLGGAFGVAILGTVFFHALTAGDAATRIGVFRDAAGVAMGLAAGLSGVAFLLTFLLPPRARPEEPATASLSA